MNQKLFVFFFSFNFLYLTVYCQQTSNLHGKAFIGTDGIKKNISGINAASNHKVSVTKPLDSTSVKPYRSSIKKNPNKLIPAFNHPQTTAAAAEKIKVDSASRASANKFTLKDNLQESAKEIWSNFLAIDFIENPNGWPPDPSGAVGDKQVIIATNNGIKIFKKPNINQAPLTTPMGYSSTLANGLFVSLEKFFEAVLPLQSGISDPHIRYDRLTKRWFIVAIEVNPSQTNNLIFLAVSDSSNVENGSGFTFYSFNSSIAPFNSSETNNPFLDFPTLGLDKNSVLIGGNQFGNDSMTNIGYIINKKQLLKGHLIIYPVELGVSNYLTGNSKGIFTPQGVYNDDPDGNKSLFAGINYTQNALALASIAYTKKGVPFLSTTYNLKVAPFNNPIDNSSPGGMVSIDQQDTRLFAAAIYKNKLTGKSSLWTSHAVGVNKAGGNDLDNSTNFKHARTGSRWYQIQDVFTHPSLAQSGTLYDAVEPDDQKAIQFFNPSIATNGQGYTLLSGTTDAYNQCLNVFTATRNNEDVKGIFSSVNKITTSTAIYSPYIYSGGNKTYINRWGDFSLTIVDPMDDQTIWTFQEYADVDNSYGIRAVQVKAPAPATPQKIAPVTNDNNVIVNIIGIPNTNTGFFDPGKDKGGPGYNQLTVQSTGNILVSNIKFINPLELRMQLNIKHQPAGNYTLKITNPDGQFVLANYEVRNCLYSNIKPDSSKCAGNKINAAIIYEHSLSPNPAFDKTTLKVSAAKSCLAKIILTDVNGGMVYAKDSYIIKGKNQIIIPLSNCIKGNYFVSIMEGNEVLLNNQKIIKL